MQEMETVTLNTYEGNSQGLRSIRKKGLLKSEIYLLLIKTNAGTWTE